MSKFIVAGARALSGEIAVNGSKNAALAVLAATLLGKGQSQIENVPEISDVRVFLEILKYLGAKVDFSNRVVTVDATAAESRQVSSELAGQLRGSVLLAGALLGRFGRVGLQKPGGDAIGSRPIDVHLDGFKKLGATIRENDLIEIEGKLEGTKISLPISSVTGTENLIMAAVLAQGVTEIRMAATEPHVQDLCDFLIAMGAKISGVGTPTLRITGVRFLTGARFRICSDEIETVTFAVAAAVTRGQVTIHNVNVENLDAPLAAFDRMGVKFILQGGKNKDSGRLQILKSDEPYRAAKIVTGVFPQLLTDEQPLLGVLATQAEGETLIHDWIYEGRQGYLRVLVEMGAKVVFDDVHRARITGPVKLKAAEIRTPDLRAGASILIASLVADGQSIIYNAEIIDRGYERLDERLNQLGAKIERTE
ncbi:MAG: UDP-N-acetylglucosamine 1-carboxyvinyltransferase [Candidatus Doudnabacteria bacterium RIFCSPHIGHO2_02_FULL_48_21]|uniref:UDP-N-acetylglucosamine 1-carboxyvinyltransferase n=1 Tax=Candidatus Doudnabacteria bacterium RIFCSPLOWO2_02_FULL_48_13 TaxID=1817845 RepID=A0A1F5QCQ7_9BACT|nr:MAG: UDP-N-acetylglucosamine 1-carboxyvinyltransferase [Candidatus Doudnabacteria bacterium RIFCSPHIGHO2_01_48_18]OGE79179.1 MAG: UDP-N-acetylglucosamine 1-carboxyvinyltransferase [Candidatus Doudnabacteria bacterium RIFCSPHIGHO2_01_FULL_48_180]OGE91811.1 MAG: UDP-N-acetylglucosamine 1-carboxyvinyltransferase [Candidatus Doudnabacteria bacterium RIFCSPHIGHO2_12_FULL_47_25]OGE93661.1 MAG: UDP-N-acetylglucosamine 1-carboxyvinyltransferase [Candidatus Doudnabacteria bacterium RIFCSPHIGHO2_02_FUL